MRRRDRRSRTRWVSVAASMSGLLGLASGCGGGGSLVATDVPLCPDVLWTLIAEGCTGLDALTCDALASHCEALEEMR